MLKKTLLVLSLACSVALSQEITLTQQFPIVNAYVKQYKGKRDIEQTKKLLEDKCFISANGFIYDANKQISVEVISGDPHDKSTQKTRYKKIPDYKNALNTLGNCIKENNNPVAAWEALFIINSYIGLDIKENGEIYKNASKILYDEKSCDGILNYGDIHSKGISIKPDKQKALKIYKDGSAICNSDWHKIVFDMRIANLEKEKK
jgi:hypothetical protein